MSNHYFTHYMSTFCMLSLQAIYGNRTKSGFEVHLPLVRNQEWFATHQEQSQYKLFSVVISALYVSTV